MVAPYHTDISTPTNPSQNFSARWQKEKMINPQSKRGFVRRWLAPLGEQPLNVGNVGMATRQRAQNRAASRTIAVVPLVLTLLAGVLMSGAGAQTPPPAKPEAPSGPPQGDPLGPDLFIAIRSGSSADIQAVLAKGAKVDAPNWLGVTPLMWAALVGNEEACKSLIAAGANVNALSRIGNVLAIAEYGGNTNIVRLLMSHGARPIENRADKISPLMTAAGQGHIDILALLLPHYPNVNAADINGATALMYAAKRGQTRAARMLVDAGADVNVRDKHGRTPLMYAAIGGYSACTQLLLDRRANVQLRDQQGRTALDLAAHYASDMPQVKQALLRAGAKANVARTNGQTSPVVLAREYPALATRTISAATPEQTRTAAQKGLTIIEKSTRSFSNQAACVSCHHQGMGLTVTGLAKERGFTYDRALAMMQATIIVKSDEAIGSEVEKVIAHPEMMKYAPGVDMDELTPMLAFNYSGLLAHNTKLGKVQADLVRVLASQQSADGKWGFVLHREPMQSSVFATTAMTLRLLQAYMPADRAEEGRQRVQKALGWLIATKPVTNEDKTWRLLGLQWAKAAPAEIAKAQNELRLAQRPDGGWAQLPVSQAGSDGGDSRFTRSDAHATGQALYALHQSGLPVTNETYRQGVRYLVKTQDADGSWLVTKRAIPANTYMDAGFPHGESQYASYVGTCWATMALMLAAPPHSPKQLAQGATR
jgi:ankyrin repeat protein